MIKFVIDSVEEEKQIIEFVDLEEDNEVEIRIKNGESYSSNQDKIVVKGSDLFSMFRGLFHPSFIRSNLEGFQYEDDDE